MVRETRTLLNCELSGRARCVSSEIFVKKWLRQHFGPSGIGMFPLIRWSSKQVPTLLAAYLLVLVPLSWLLVEPRVGRTWKANAEIVPVETLTMEGLGAMQGVSLHDGKVYLYG